MLFLTLCILERDTFAKSEDPDEIPQNMALFHQDLHCLLSTESTLRERSTIYILEFIIDPDKEIL